MSTEPSDPSSNIAEFKVGDKVFRLDKEKARRRLEGKMVINGTRSAELNVLPLKYHEAYRIYKQMKANHWEPDVIDMTKDCAMWNGDGLSAKERWIIEMGVGYFSAAEGIVGDSVLHAIEDNLTAAELKHASLRQIAEESIHMDSLLHIISSLNIDLDEVTAKFQDIPSIAKKNAFITRHMPELKSGLDLTITANKQKFAKALFGITQVMEGTQFYALFAMILSLQRQNKMTGIGQMFQYTLRDECLIADTEMLTPTGWVRVQELAQGQKVAQYHDDGSISFALPERTSSSHVPYTWKFSSEQGHVNLGTSPKHRMVMITKHGNLKITEAEACQHNPYSRHLMAGLKQGGTKVSLTPHERFLIALQADGHISQAPYRNGNRCGHIRARFDLTKPRKQARLREILAATEYPYTETPGHPDGPVIFFVEVSPKEARKTFDWIKLEEVTASWCQEFIDELSYWDGHRVGGAEERITYGSVIKANADAVQAIAALANYRTHYSCIPDDRSETYSDYHRIQINRHRNYFRGGAIQKARVEGETLVYGVQVPTGMLVVRYQGAVAITGNSNHISLGQYILEQLVAENPDIWTPEFQADLVEFMREGVALEKEFVMDCLPEDAVGMTQKDFLEYVDYNADRRLSSLGLPTLSNVKNNPFLWLDEVIFLKKEKNFFETRVTEYQTSGSVKNTNEDDLI